MPQAQLRRLESGPTNEVMERSVAGVLEATRAGRDWRGVQSNGSTAYAPSIPDAFWADQVLARPWDMAKPLPVLLL